MADAVAAEPCLHLDFDANVTVARIAPDAATAPKAFMAEMTVQCAACKVPFTFPGMPVGMSYDEPRTSPNGQEVRVPMRPADAEPGFGTGLPGFGMTFAGRADT